MIYPPKPRPGDRVAVLSPSAGLPQIFPEVYELGLSRLRDELGLVPVEFPSTRKMGASAAQRAADLHAAFADPTITAVLSSIGGDDQIAVLPHLDPDLLRAHPKPFFGYSDNTNLLNYLWRLGIVAYHGGSVMVHLGRGGAPHPAHLESLSAALFTSGWFELTPPPTWGDEHGDWADPATLTMEPPMQPSEGWSWHQASQVVEGRSWGGCLEVLAWSLMADQVAPAGEHDGGVLFIETSEEMPSAEEVYRILRGMGERGLLARYPAVLVGRPKAWCLEQPSTAEQKRAYVQAQREAVLRAFGEYQPDAMIVFDVDLGHTDPQLVIPYGGSIRVDGPARRISVRY